MKSRWIWILLSVVAAAQWAVPAWHIVKFERTLRAGALYRFRCAPVDPFDAFRGRFVAVSPEIGPVAWPHDARLEHGQKVFVKLRHGPDGFAEGEVATLKPPAHGDYVVAYYGWTISNTWIRVTLPFDRFYMPENLAQKAEQAYQRNARDTNVWLAVRIMNGAGVVENVYINDRPIAEVARDMAEKR